MAEQDSPARILQKIARSDILPDAEDHIQSGRLIMVDQKAANAKRIELGARQLAELLFSSASDARRKSGAKKVVVMADTGALLEKGDYAKQAELEQEINLKFQENENLREQVEVICCYNRAAVQKMSLKHLFPLVNSHGSIVDSDWKYNTWYPAAVVEIITAGIEKSLDSLTARLILQTFKLVYKIDKDAIISNPALFEETLRKILGGNAADVVLASIMDEARRRIML